MNHKVLLSVVAASGWFALAPAAVAQSLFQPRAETAPVGESADPAISLYSVSLFAIQPPRERQFSPNDLVTIVVRENTRAFRDQEVTEEKEYENTFSLLNRTLLNQFLQFRLPTGGQRLRDIDLANSETTFEAEGEYIRNDRIDTRLTARVVEVKPNGTLLLEARTSTRTDQDSQTIMLTGLCRPQDITRDNTVLSTQLYGLSLDMQNEGQVRRATKKGVIPRVLETIFNF